jgi:hypothetical protein
MNEQKELRLSLNGYVRKQYLALESQVTTPPYSTNNLPPNFPISRGTYFNMKKGNGVRTCTIIKVSQYLDWQEPQIIF